MSDDKTGLMPDDASLVPEKPDLASAIVERISDDIDDSKSLRSLRKTAVCALSFLALIFYVALFYFVFFSESLDALSLQSSSVTIAILLVFAVITTIFVVSVSKAIFGVNSGKETPFTPLHAIIQLLKDTKY